MPSFCQNKTACCIESTLQSMETFSPSFTILSWGSTRNTGGDWICRKAEAEISPAMFPAWQTYFPESSGVTLRIRRTALSSTSVREGVSFPSSLIHFMSGAGSPPTTHENLMCAPVSVETFSGAFMINGFT
eukprot:GFUD01025624.1.p1 GENE.GFUD01025624.1~~GFUD01025624.1.p1  ORF type:complete len:131 (+),score=0.08 GFUD01025624.1:99-491(+)